MAALARRHSLVEGLTAFHEMPSALGLYMPWKIPRTPGSCRREDRLVEVRFVNLAPPLP
jgi:hypothetical protein